MKIYIEKSEKGCFLEIDVQDPEDLHDLQNGLLFLFERKKIIKIAELNGKTEYVIDIKKFK